MQSSRDIPWKRLIVEGAAIVLSILLAFGIDAWWDERKERDEEQQILSDLKEEFTLIRDVLTRHSNEHERRLQALKNLLAVFDMDRSAWTKEVIRNAMEDLLAPTTTDISNGTLLALLSSGRLEIISNRKLREGLVNWESAIDEVWDDQESHAKLVYEVHVPYFVKEGFGMGEVVGYWYGDNTTLVRSITDDLNYVDRLMNDARFRSIVEIRYMYKRHTSEEFVQAIAAANAIVSEIETSMR